MAFGITKNSLKKATVSKGSGVVRSAKRAIMQSGDGPVSSGARNPAQVAGPAGPAIGNPTYSTPGAMTAVTPIAAPPVISDPFLTPTDLANQALDLASVDQYLGNVDLTVSNARTDAGIKTAQIDTAEGRNLDSADWNSAARGLAQSSIKDTTKANLSADAAAARSGTADSLKNAVDYGSSEHQRADTVVKPAITTKYNQKAKQDAQDRTDAWNADPAHQGQPAPAAAGVLSTQSTPITQTAPAFKTAISDGYVWHIYPDGRRVAVRKASGNVKVTDIGGM